MFMPRKTPNWGTVLMVAVIAVGTGIWVQPAFAQRARVEVTGQTTSYASGDDGDIQAGVPFPRVRFRDKGDGTVVDRLTGLIWLKDTNCFGPLSWLDALQAANTLAASSCHLTDGSAAGDWRLPNIKELQSLVDFSQLFPALPPGHPFLNVQSDGYWSSTTDALSPPLAWTLYMPAGGAVAVGKENLHSVLPVRCGECQVPGQQSSYPPLDRGQQGRHRDPSVWRSRR
jgi:hypothetical protein